MDARVHLNPGHFICLKAAFQEHLVEQEKSYQNVILKSAAYCFVFALSIFFSLSLSCPQISQRDASLSARGP